MAVFTICKEKPNTAHLWRNISFGWTWSNLSIFFSIFLGGGDKLEQLTPELEKRHLKNRHNRPNFCLRLN